MTWPLRQIHHKKVLPRFSKSGPPEAIGHTPSRRSGRESSPAAGPRNFVGGRAAIHRHVGARPYRRRGSGVEREWGFLGPLPGGSAPSHSLTPVWRGGPFFAVAVSSGRKCLILALHCQTALMAEVFSVSANFRVRPGGRSGPYTSRKTVSGEAPADGPPGMAGASREG